MSNTEMTAEDFFKSITGFDEIAIQKAFGASFVDLRNDQFRFLRALVFVDLRRDGKKDADAYTEVMGLGIGAVDGWFADVEAEVFPEEPVTDQGKAAAPAS
ncbi:hypothetical protein [Demequina oxidasica]|uniref:hypothetical protein n=1 Tax=Demequina oxidasica TaxID=676199 RepID=UPI000785C76D|nr:hypothetical protein [Demequina oxidasica]